MKIPVKKERIFRILALEENLTVSELSRKTGLAKSYVSKTLTELKKKNIVWGTEELHVNYMDLIREWGDFKRDVFRRIKPLVIDMFFPDKIKQIKDYVASGPFAEMLIQGESPGRPIIIYLKEKEFAKTEKVLKSFGKTGKGYVFFYAYDGDVFRNGLKIKGWNIASLPQVCADIIALGTYADLGIKLFERWLDAGRRV
ncbi:MAG: winged helix-turn-helix domain-containing protein [Nanoarchaeota archaeon]|nr:winged helix-turn-helix domain-containing protein [Nanoarchaeota archaeon]